MNMHYRPELKEMLSVGLGKMFLRFETNHNCSVYEDTDSTYLLFSTAFFSPTVDEGYEMGWLAAASAMSGVYSMGGRPIIANALLGYPRGKLATHLAQGGSEAINRAGCFMAGEYRIDSKDPFYGFSVVGKVDKTALRTHHGAQAGDVLILTKPLGAGIALDAMRQGEMDMRIYEQILPYMSDLNHVGYTIAEEEGVRALNAVGAQGLIGHCIQMMGTKLGLELYGPRIPLYERTLEMAQRREGAALNFDKRVVFPDGLDPIQKQVLSNAEPNGGLLIAVSPQHLESIIQLIETEMGSEAYVIGLFNEDQTLRIRG